LDGLNQVVEGVEFHASARLSVILRIYRRLEMQCALLLALFIGIAW
jgi:hypothetical protein